MINIIFLGQTTLRKKKGTAGNGVPEMMHTLFTLPGEGCPCECCKEAAHARITD